MKCNTPYYNQSEGPAQSVPVSYKVPAPFQQGGAVTITYDYDPLNRLTEANYSTGDYYHYGYDAVGNRLSQDTQVGGLPITTTYLYDDANRVQSVGGVTYTFDANGNLLNDGINTYTYDSANRLKTVNSGSVTASYAYNGLNDRLQQTVNGTTSTFTMDLNTGLTQALSDGTNHYIYGVDRIAQVNSATEYFLGDALGSVRQLTDQSGEVTYASAYDPYGVTTSSVGASQSAYGYTNEYTSNDLVYLRARMYAPYLNQFIQPDTIVPDPRIPADWHKYTYVRNNPINYTDPSGHITEKESPDAMKIVKELKSKYNIYIPRDWGYRLYDQISPHYSDEIFGFLSDCQWTDGSWRSLKELQLTRDGIEAMATKMGGEASFAWAMEALVTIRRMPEDHYSTNGHDYVAWTVLDVKLYNDTFNGSDIFASGIVVHELAHVWDTRQMPIFRLSTNMISKTKSFKGGVYDKPGQLEAPLTSYGESGPREDFAETVAICVYPGFKGASPLGLYPIRKDYIEGLLNVLHGNKCS